MSPLKGILFIFYFGKKYIVILFLLAAAASGIDTLINEFGIFNNQIVSGYKAADRKPIFTVGKYEEKKYEWKEIGKGEGYNVYYDNASVSLDDKNGIATVTIKFQKAKQIDLTRNVISFNGSDRELLVTDFWSNTRKASPSFKVEKVKGNQAYSFICDTLNTDLEVRKEVSDGLSIDAFIDKHAAAAKGAYPEASVKEVAANYNTFLIGGGVKLLDSNGNYSRTVYVFPKEAGPVKASLFDDKVLYAEKNVAIVKQNFQTGLPESTREKPVNITLHKGEKYTIVQNRNNRLLLKAKRSNGESVIVPASGNNIIIPKDRKIVEIQFVYNGSEYHGWVEASCLTVEKK